MIANPQDCLFRSAPKTLLIALVVLMCSFRVFSESYAPWIDAAMPIINISNKHRQAEAWGMCSAVNRVVSEIQSAESPSMAKNSSNRANGAAIAAGMTYYVKGEEGIRYTEDQKRASWKLSQEMSKSIPEVQSTAIIAELETLPVDVWMKKILANLEVCGSNSDGQQLYIDAWRDTAASGFLELQ